jgi:uncharacterized protein YndB with AHSA1/START domain
MEQSPLSIKCKIQIAKPAAEVFRAIVEPSEMSNYFIASASGPLASGTTVDWKFPEFDMSFPVRVSDVRSNEYVSFFWDGQDKREHLVEMSLQLKGNDTVITVIENGGVNEEAGIAWLKSNTEGWANFLACMKAWLEYGVHLRKGAFDFMKG